MIKIYNSEINVIGGAIAYKNRNLCNKALIVDSGGNHTVGVNEMSKLIVGVNDSTIILQRPSLYSDESFIISIFTPSDNSKIFNNIGEQSCKVKTNYGNTINMYDYFGFTISDNIIPISGTWCSLIRFYADVPGDRWNVIGHEQCGNFIL